MKTRVYGNPMKHPRFFSLFLQQPTSVRKLFCVISGAYPDRYMLVIFVTLEFGQVIHVAYLLDCPIVMALFQPSSTHLLGFLV